MAKFNNLLTKMQPAKMPDQLNFTPLSPSEKLQAKTAGDRV
jgi:hypothetical protein